MRYIQERDESILNKKCVIVYRRGELITNFYNLGRIQNLKRMVLGMVESYDKLEFGYISNIYSKCNELVVISLDGKVDRKNYLFNKILERGLDIHKTLVYFSKLEISPFPYQCLEDGIDLDYTFEVADRAASLNEYHRASNKLVTIALESLHKLYWKTGVYEKWHIMKEKAESDLREFQDNINKKYGKEAVDSRVLTDRESEEMHRLEKELLEEFKVEISRNNTYNYAIESNAFTLEWEYVNDKYWKLDKNKYYVLGLCGIGSMVRKIKNIDLTGLLYETGIKGMEQLKMQVNKDKFHKNLRKVREYTRGATGDDYKIGMNEWLLSIIQPIYDLSDQIHLFECSYYGIYFVIGYQVNLVDVLIRIKQMKIEKYIDFIDIGYPNEKEAKISIFDIDNDRRLNAEYLNNMISEKARINGCNEQQVKSYFKNIRDNG